MKEPASAGSFLFGECSCGVMTGKREGARGGHSETRGRISGFDKMPLMRTPTPAACLRTVAARKPREHGGGRNEQTDRRHAPDA